MNVRAVARSITGPGVTEAFRWPGSAFGVRSVVTAPATAQGLTTGQAGRENGGDALSPLCGDSDETHWPAARPRREKGAATVRTVILERPGDGMSPGLNDRPDLLLEWVLLACPPRAPTPGV